MPTQIIRDLAAGAKRVQEIKKEMSDVVFQEEIVKLRLLLVSAQNEVLEMEETIRQLKDAAKFRETLIDSDGFKYREKDGKPTGKPFCPACEINHGKFFQISFGGTVGIRSCPNCKYNYGVDARRFE